MRTMKNLRNQIVFIVAVLVVWQVVYQMGSFPELMFPSLGKIFQSLIKGFSRDGLGAMTLYSLSLIAKGLLIGIVLAFIQDGAAGRPDGAGGGPRPAAPVRPAHRRLRGRGRL